jgi:Rrf2 family protein
MAQVPERPMTSEEIAGWLHTNPVVVRRMVAGLREAGIVSAARGHGGGWTLAKPASSISLADVAAALEESFLSINTQPENPRCLVEKSVTGHLDGVRLEVERLLAERLATVTLADIAAECGEGIAAYKENRHAV